MTMNAIPTANRPRRPTPAQRLSPHSTRTRWASGPFTLWVKLFADEPEGPRLCHCGAPRFTREGPRGGDALIAVSGVEQPVR